MNNSLAKSLMRDFALATGIVGDAPPRRYLWTDAFAVCNFLGFAQPPANAEYLALASLLVNQVHHTLGRHRADDVRRGWISGLPEAVGERHPTHRGLRIGKPAPERRADEPLDPNLEWERDGQYFHYLTKWMHALHRMHVVTGESSYHDWAVELALAAHRSFTRDARPGAAKRMTWKMSIDLKRPLVASMGQHDPLDGLISCLELRAASNDDGPDHEDLRILVEDYAKMCQSSNWVTNDSLGVGCLLDAAARMAQSPVHAEPPFQRILCDILQASEASLPGIEYALNSGPIRGPRLAFRELGLAIGLKAVQRLVAMYSLDLSEATPFHRLLAYESLAARIENWWSAPEHRAAQTWIEHADINNVMLATTLEPDGYLAA